MHEYIQIVLKYVVNKYRGSSSNGSPILSPSSGGKALQTRVYCQEDCHKATKRCIGIFIEALQHWTIPHEKYDHIWAFFAPFM